MRLIHKDQKGFTLIEVLIAVAIFAVVAVAANAVIVQIVQSNRTSSHMVALRQVQQAGYRVNLDALQAQNVSNGTGSGGFPLTLNWTAWEGGEFHKVVYYLNLTTPSGGLYQLQRQEKIGNNTPTTTIVGQYIYFNTTSCSWNATAKVLTLNITAMIGLETESRTYEIKPRCSV